MPLPFTARWLPGFLRHNVLKTPTFSSDALRSRDKCLVCVPLTRLLPCSRVFPPVILPWICNPWRNRTTDRQHRAEARLFGYAARHR
jgi:hypothetical protein